MKQPCYRRGIVARALEYVKSWSAHAPILPPQKGQRLTWREVADFRERLKGISTEGAREILRILGRSLERTSEGRVEQ